MKVLFIIYMIYDKIYLREIRRRKSNSCHRMQWQMVDFENTDNEMTNKKVTEK